MFPVGVLTQSTTQGVGWGNETCATGWVCFKLSASIDFQRTTSSNPCPTRIQLTLLRLGIEFE